MVAYKIQLGAGITVGAGVGLGDPITAFTLYPGDITFNGELYHGYSSITSDGFTSDGTDTYNGVVYNMTGSLPTDIAAIWVQAGLNVNNAYAWNISFASGGNVIARVALNPNGINNAIAIVPIDQSNTNWQSGNLGGPTQVGTFTFPAVFTLYTPITQISNSGDWC